MQGRTVSRLIIGHFQAHPRRVLALTGLALALAACAVLPPLLVAHAVDRAIGGTIDAATVVVVAIGVGALALWDGVLTWLRRRVTVAHQIATRAHAAHAHFDYCIRLPLREFGEGNHAALIRSFDDLDTVVESVASTSTEFSANLVIVASYAALMLAVEPRLSLVFFALAGLGLAASVVATRLSRRACEAWLPRRDSRFAHIVECFSAILTVKTLSAHDDVRRPFAVEQAREDAAFRVYRNRLGFAAATNRFWSVGMPGVGAAAGAMMLLGGQITAGTLVLFLAVSSGLVAALTAMHFQIEQFQEAAAAHARMTTVTAGEPEDLAGAASAPIGGPIAIRDLGFSHAATSDALDGVDLSIGAREHLAIIGRSGEGKTTLAQLLARLYVPARGTILLDGTAAHDLPLDAYRRSVVLVPHATQIFAATLRDNVRLWNAAMSDAEVDAALARAGLDIDPDTPVGERGNPLSAGQRQRVGLARVFLRRPAVLILDEATSALDAESEAAVLQNIREMMHGRILVVITHRAQVAASFDRIVRIEAGRISADDRRAPLRQASG